MGVAEELVAQDFCFFYLLRSDRPNCPTHPLDPVLVSFFISSRFMALHLLTSINRNAEDPWILFVLSELVVLFLGSGTRKFTGENRRTHRRVSGFLGRADENDGGWVHLV